jgi:hypothetical protein
VKDDDPLCYRAVAFSLNPRYAVLMNDAAVGYVLKDGVDRWEALDRDQQPLSGPLFHGSRREAGAAVMRAALSSQAAATKTPAAMSESSRGVQELCRCEGDHGLFVWREDPLWWSCVGCDERVRLMTGDEREQHAAQQRAWQ